MKKIAIFQYDLKMGGIQKSLINLLNNIDKTKVSIDLYLFDKDNFFDSAPGVNIIYLPKYSYYCRFIPFNILMKFKHTQITKKYDLAIDFNSYSMECAINAIKVNAKKRIIWCHNDLVEKYKEEPKYRILWFFFKGKYKYFDKIVAVSEGAKKSVIKKLPFNETDVEVIPNIINTNEIIDKSQETIDYIKNPNKYNLITVGRICHQKGYDILVDLMKEVNNNNIDLYIVGSGEDYDKIYHKIKDCNLDNIHMLGSAKNPYKYMNQADGFILTSRYEGQGMVILEAKTLGLDIFIPKHLEQYVEGVKGYNDLIEVLKKLTKNQKPKNKKIDKLTKYNQNILESFYKL